MRKIAFGLLIFTLAASGARAQDTATQQEIEQLTGQLQNIIDREAALDKHLSDMEKEISDLRDKVNAPAANNYASADDLQKLASQVQEMDRKRQEDKELILAKMEEFAKLSTESPHVHHSSTPRDTTDDTTTTTPDAAPQPAGYDYPVKAGDSLSAIVRAYREKGVKTTLSLVLKANPGLSSKTLYVGKVIRIPDPAMK